MANYGLDLRRLCWNYFNFNIQLGGNSNSPFELHVQGARSQYVKAVILGIWPLLYFIIQMPIIRGLKISLRCEFEIVNFDQGTI